MKNNLSRVLIETMVRKTISDINEAPKRSIRNIVDMALQFSKGRFQKLFFCTAQTMLKNENSAYYKLVSDSVTAFDTERIVDFGLNLGYNSCTAGAKKIRSIETLEHYNIPWSVTLVIDGNIYSKKGKNYQEVIRQGEELGIYTWMLHSLNGAEKAVELACNNPQCAFILYCSPDEVTDSLLEKTKLVHNIMFVIHYTSGVKEVCNRLREEHILYSVYYTYGDQDLENILKGKYVEDAETLHPIFTAFLAKPDCIADVQTTVYEYVTKTRNEQRHPTVVWDSVQDGRLVDSIISEDSCSGWFDSEGDLYTFSGKLEKLDYNLFEQPLQDIFRSAFPKKWELLQT